MSDDRPYIDFKQVKHTVSIPEAFEKLGISDQFTEKRGVWTGICPLPTHPHGPKPNAQQFKVDNKKGTWMWRCFGDCDRGGDVIELVKCVMELDDAHVRFWFADNFGDVLNLNKPKATRQRTPKRTATKERVGESNPTQAEGIMPMKFYLNVDTEAAREYLHSRGISMATAERYGVGMYTKPGKMFSGYLVVPCYRYPKEKPDENPVGYVGRWPGEDFDDDHPRYKTGFECSNAVFGLAEALATETAPLIVVEGLLKALWLVDRGYTNAVSTFTASMSDVQAELLINTARPIVLAFDGNEAGKSGMRAAAGKLIKQAFVRVVALPDGIEPDEINSAELEEFFGFAKP